MAIDDASRLLVPNWWNSIFLQATNCLEVRARCRFLHVFIIQDSHLASILIKKESVLSLKVIVRAYGTVFAVNETELVTNLPAAWDDALQLKQGPVTLSVLLHAVPTWWNKVTEY